LCYIVVLLFFIWYSLIFVPMHMAFQDDVEKGFPASWPVNIAVDVFFYLDLIVNVRTTYQVAILLVAFAVNGGG